MASCTSLYQILGIPTSASRQEIKTAYRQLARTCHPDVAVAAAAIGGKGGSSADEFLKIHAAYSTLSDPEKRADYDRKLVIRGYQPLTASSKMTSGYCGGFTRRKWETDQCW